jgi:hypothetical protein
MRSAKIESSILINFQLKKFHHLLIFNYLESTNQNELIY